jgi:Adenylate and Guanylate cyclase catalytic domain
MVFFLLENIYSAFDKLADARKVFKVETIGDCCKYFGEHSELGAIMKAS